MTTPAGTFEPDQPTSPADAPKLLGTRDMWKAIDHLTNTSTVRLARDSGNYERVTLPSLFDQLVEAMESGAGQQTGRMQESKPPLDAAALSLLIEIAEHIRTGCWNWRIKRKFDSPLDLRAFASTVVRDGTPEEVDIVARKVRSWCGQIRATISSDPDRTWRMHGAHCRTCQASTVVVYLEDGTETRQPALIVHSEDGTIQKVECAFCGSTLAGPELTEIVRDTLTQMARKTA